MVKYNSKGSLPQNADYYALLNRSDADWRDSVRQGYVFSSAGAGCLNYGVRDLITTSTTKMRWQFKLNAVAGLGTTRYICSEYRTSDNERGWAWHINSSNRLSLLIGNNGGSSASINTDNFLDDLSNKYQPISGDFVDIVWDSGIITVTVNNKNYTYDASAIQTAIYNNNSPNLNIGGYQSSASAASSYNGSLCCFKIWVDNILDTDTPKFVAPMGDKQGIDLISGTIPSVVGTVDMTARADDASYDCELRSFAVKEFIADGDMEASDTSAWKAADSTLSKVASTVPGSTQALRITATGATFWAYQLNTLVIGRLYQLKGCARGDGTAVPTAFAGAVAVGSKWTGTASTDWQYFDVTVVCTTSTTAYIGSTDATGWVEFDNVSFTQIYPRLLDDSGYAGNPVAPYTEFSVKPYPNTFTGNWHEFTHAYFDKSNTDIWEDYVRESINYISEEPNYWHVSELNPSYLEKYIKHAYRNKIFCGIDGGGDYVGALMVFENGIPEELQKDLRFWRKRKYFEVATRQINIELGIEYILTGKSDSATVKIEAYNGENWIVMATGVTVTAGEYSEGITFSPYDFEGEVTYLMRVVSEVDDSVEELIDVTSDTVVRITATTTVATENVVLNRIRLYANSIIFWGDGDSTSLTENTTYTDLTHNYAVAGSYQVKISKADKVKEFRITNNKWSNFTTYDLRNADLDYFWLNSTGSGFTVNTSHMTGWTVDTSWYLYNMPSGTYNIDSSHMTGWTVGASWSLYNMPSGTYNIDSSHMTGWTVGNSWYLNRMPAGTYNIDSSHMTGWTVDTSWYLYNMPSGTYNIDSSHMTGWTVGASWNLYNMPAGTYTLSVDTMRNWTAILTIRIYDLIDSNTGLNMMTEAEVIKVIEDIYAGRLTFTRTIHILNIAGTNASLTDAGARTKVDHLRAGYDGVNTFRSWTINVNGYPA